MVKTVVTSDDLGSSIDVGNIEANKLNVKIDGSTITQNPSGELEANSSSGPIDYITVDGLLTSTETSRGVGEQWKAGEFSYIEQDPASTDYHVVNASGIKLKAVPNNTGWITSCAFGWAANSDVTSEFDRIMPLWNQGDKFLICEEYIYDNGSIHHNLPDDFTIKGANTNCGFIFASPLSSLGWLDIGHRNRIEGLSWTYNYTYSGTPAGRIILSTSKHDFIFKNNFCNFPCDIYLYLVECDRFSIKDNNFINAKWFVTVSGDYGEILRNYFEGHLNSGTTGEGVKTIPKDTPILGLNIEGNTFYRMGRDGVDTTGGIQYSTIINNKFIECGQTVGFGGIDLKTNQESRTSPAAPNKYIIISNNYFIDSLMGVKSTFSGDYDTVPPTQIEVETLAVSDIKLINNVYRSTGALSSFNGNALQCGLGGITPINSESNGETFIGGSRAFGFGSNQLTSGFRFENLTYHYEGQDDRIDNCEGVSVHFTQYVHRSSAGNGVSLENCEDVQISGNVKFIESGNYIKNAFLVRDNSNRVVFKDIRMVDASAGSNSLVRLGKPANAGNLVLKNIEAYAARHILSSSGDPANIVPQVTVENCTHLEGKDSMINLSTLANTSNIDYILVRDCVGDNTTSLISGALITGTPVTINNERFI